MAINVDISLKTSRNSSLIEECYDLGDSVLLKMVVFAKAWFFEEPK